MDRLILSEDVIIELDGKEVTLKEGDSIKVDKNVSIFGVDNEFEVNTEKGKMLVEPSDKIQIGGQYKALASAEFTSGGKKFVLEKGDTFDVLEEGFWEGLKTGFNEKAKAQAIAKVYDVVKDITDMIIEMHGDWAEENPGLPKQRSPYAEIVTSKPFYLLRRISQTGGNPKRIRQLMIVKKADPFEAVNQIRDKAADIGATGLAKYIDEAMPAGGIMDKLGKVWRSVSGQPGSGAKLEQKRQKIGTTKDGTKYILVGSEAYGPMGSSTASWVPAGELDIANVELETAPVPPRTRTQGQEPRVAAKPRKAKLAASKKKVDVEEKKARLRNIWGFIKQSGAKTVPGAIKAVAKRFGKDVSEEEIRKAIGAFGKTKKRAATSKPKPAAELVPKKETSKA